MTQDSNTIKVFSLLSGDTSADLTFLTENDCKIIFNNSSASFDLSDISTISFWKKINSQNADAVLLPLSSFDLQQLKEKQNNNSSNMFDMHRPWQYIDAAVIVLLTGDNIHDAVLAAQMDFDGILAEPFVGGHIQTIIRGAIDRKQQKQKLNSRYQRLQRVIRAINQNRHILQSKVDLLCNDLVQNNRDIAGKMNEMSKAYDFQKSLTGEFDMKYMLHKALKHISDNLEHTSSAIYICDTDRIELMLMDSWFDGEITPHQLDECLKNSIIPETIAKNDTVIINSAGNHNAFPKSCCCNLCGLSICGVPVRHTAHNEGILVLYRSETMPFTRHEIDQLEPILAPLSRSIEALLNLQDMLTMV
ncbi:MAG: GAF domain-containing protein [Sedimentisphaerales bacterium]|nr:GAF domain-containing protein [Sedimentisphaerales bacterium]